MTIPAWEAGKTYAPGALVVPANGTIVVQSQPTNADFETGDLTGWTTADTTKWNINSSGAYSGTYAVRASGGGTTNLDNTNIVDVTPGLSIGAQCVISITNNGTDDQGARIRIAWLDSFGTEISTSEGTLVYGKGGYWVTSSMRASAPAGAVKAKIRLVADTGSHGGHIDFDHVSWTYTYAGIPDGLAYKAVQAAPGKSAATEPMWPGVLGMTVIDNQVTWEAVLASRITWTATPLLKSGDTEPVWPTDDGASVHDGTIDWIATSPRITDTLLPQSKIVTIAANKVFVGDNDVVRYCATNDANDWHSEQDAGYLPTGLQAIGETTCTALAVYRGNLVPWTASSMQVWQVDPDPARMAIIDTVEGVGNGFNRAAVGMMNDLFFLSQLGVRSVSTAATTGTLGAADVGSPVDPLVRTAITDAVANGIEPIGITYSNASQFWIILGSTAFVYTISLPSSVKSWSRYTLPWTVTDACVKDGLLYVRTSDNDVYVLDESISADQLTGGTPTNFTATVWWPWLDLAQAGVEKMIVGIDCVVDSVTGTTTDVSLGYDERDPSLFTEAIGIEGDTRPGQIVPIPVSGVTFSVKLEHTSDQPWTLSAFTLYYNTMRMTA